MPHYHAQAAQSVRPLDWMDRYREPDRSRNELLAIHLHGQVQAEDASAAQTGLSLTFSNTSGRALISVSSITFLVTNSVSKPFLIVGARMTDEYDLADILRRGNRSKQIRSRPSLLFSELYLELFEKSFKNGA